MRLLVSVRSAREVEAALSGGADIIDAKEPSHGSLGRVSSPVLRDILEQVPARQEASVALGDFSDSAEVRLTIAALPLPRRAAPIYVKLGFAGVADAERIRTMLQVARTVAATSSASSIRIVAVAYADSGSAQSAPLEIVCEAAIASGAAGVLVDTRSKTGGHLFNWVGPERLRDLLQYARQAHLLTAVAGGLDIDQLELVFSTRPDVVGFRGAVCVGGRTGRLSRERVEQVRRRVVHCSSAVLR
jgi:uncharacterized protein (UPF0264 family)